MVIGAVMFLVIVFTLGCIQAMRCHTNTCPTGVTTHNKRLRHGLVVGEK